MREETPPGRAEQSGSYVRRALECYRSGELEEAESDCRNALAINPQSVDAYSALAAVLVASSRFREAEYQYRQLLALAPDDACGWSNLALVLDALDRLPEAEIACRRALACRPDFPDALNNLGSILRKCNRFNEAEEVCRSVIAVRPDYASLSNLATVLMDLGRVREAISLYQQSLALQPNKPQTWNNLALALDELDCVPEAKAAHRHAISLLPSYADAKVNLAVLLLGLGEFGAGWKLYEFRCDPTYAGRNTFPPPVKCPQWQGESLAGRSLLVWHEQGLGDMIQFGRFTKPLRALGVHITVACKPPLRRLFRGVPGINVTDENEASLDQSQFDYWTFAASLPLQLQTTVTTIPDPVWLKPDPLLVERWSPSLQSLTGHRIGLVWKGSPDNKNDRNRSLPSLATLAPLWKLPHLSFVSLQVGAGAEEAKRPPADQPILDLGRTVTDFADSAAIIAQIDLLISVDTSVVHLAGALGKPCWVILPATGFDWRWMRRDAQTSPWYPDIRLFRQTKRGDWGGLISHLCDELTGLV